MSKKTVYLDMTTQKNQQYKDSFYEVYSKVVKDVFSSSDYDIIIDDWDYVDGVRYDSRYRYLCSSEIVIIDLTMAVYSTFYTIGIRHMAKGGLTILLYNKDLPLTNDIRFLEAIPYRLENGIISQDEAERLKKILRLAVGKYNQTNNSEHMIKADSFLYNIYNNDQNKLIETIRKKIQLARSMKTHEISQSIRMLEEAYGLLQDNETGCDELWADIMFAYRDLKVWEGMIRLYEKYMPESFRLNQTMCQQYALALNRRNKNDDRKKAIQVLEELLKEKGGDTETYGILGRIYKDYYKEKYKNNERKIEVEAYLEKATNCYISGFKHDYKDYYTGINAVTLMFIQTKKVTNTIRDMLGVIKCQLSNLGGLDSKDYWVVATLLEVNAIMGEWIEAKQALKRLLLLQKHGWEVESTINNLTSIMDVYKEQDQDYKPLLDIIIYLRSIKDKDVI